VWQTAEASRGIAKGTTRAEDVSNDQIVDALETREVPMQATELFARWQELLTSFADAFT
jgi:hypothetical protein